MSEPTPKDDNIIFDFITHRMLKVNERVIYAQHKTVALDSGDADYYDLKTIDDSGTVRRYMKECIPHDKWVQIQTM